MIEQEIKKYLEERSNTGSRSGIFESISLPSSVAFVRLLFDYDAESGVAKWQERPSWMFTGGGVNCLQWNAKYAGRMAGSMKDGYLEVGILNKKYRLHRLIWLHVYGKWPENCIDHVNHVRHDNRLSNLFLASHHENLKNQSKRNSNKSGFNGVFWDESRKKWLVSVCVNYRSVFIGRFDDVNEALKARQKANDTHGFHINHGI